MGVLHFNSLKININARFGAKLEIVVRAWRRPIFRTHSS